MSYDKSRVKLTDSVNDIIFKLSEGNPDAATMLAREVWQDLLDALPPDSQPDARQRFLDWLREDDN